MNGIQLGWSEITKIFNHDMLRLVDTGTQRTDLTKYCMFLDNFTIMNVSYAKNCFSEKTICEIIAYMSKAIKIKLDISMSFKSIWHKLMYYCNVLKPAKYKTSLLEIQSNIAILEYRISVHGIYIERVL